MDSMETNQATDLTQGQSAQAPAQGLPSQTLPESGSTQVPDAATAGAPTPVLAAGATPPAGYTPTFRYKVNKEEKEMDEWIRHAIKDEKTEKAAKELFEKANGLDLVRPKYESIQKEYKSVKETFDGLRNEVDQVLYLKDNDLPSFFQALKISDDQLFQYVRERINYLQAPPEQRREHDSRTGESRKLRELEQQNQHLLTTSQQAMAQARVVELRSVLARPDVKTVAETFDARVGRPGAFEAECIKRGKMAAYESNGQIDLPCEDAVKEVMSILGTAASAPQPGAFPQAAQGTQAPQKPNEKPPVIPAVGARSSSPVDVEIKSIEDLERIRKEKYGS